MKNRLNKTSEHKITKAGSIIYDIATDKELKNGGINKLDKKLKEAGYTKKEAEMIERDIYKAMNRLAKRKEALEKL